MLADDVGSHAGTHGAETEKSDLHGGTIADRDIVEPENSVRLAIGVMGTWLLAAGVHADPAVLRMATVAPAGTSWARELNAFGREIEANTNAQVRVKMYFGGIAGDDTQIGERIRRDQLDGAGSGGALCEQLAPTMRVLRVSGILTDYREAFYTLSRLNPTLDEEVRKHGYTLINTAPLGPHILFTRTPVRSMADLRKNKLWVWNKDDVLIAELKEFGVPIEPMSLDEAARAFDEHRIDGFAAPASVTLAFQWATRARYATDLRLDMINACVVLANRAWDKLTPEQRNVVKAAGAKLGQRFVEIGETLDGRLLGGLFERQGLQTIPLSKTFQSEFFSLAQATRERLGDKLVPTEPLQRVLGILADFRAERQATER
jgi:TRAP-type C4-dicarboxylate transport system substrate-binding protein